MTLTFNDRVRIKAYELWEANGHRHGSDLDHWSRAQDLLRASDVSEESTSGVTVADAPYRIALSRVYTFGQAETEPWLTHASGLSYKEETIRWTDGPRASLGFDLPDDCPPQIVIELTCRGAVSPRMPSVTADVSINGMPVGQLTDSLVDGQRLERAEFAVPRSTPGPSKVDLTLDIRDPRKPSNLGMGPDDRELGFLLLALVVRPA